MEKDRAKSSKSKKIRSSRSSERSPKKLSRANILARSKSSRSQSKSKVPKSTRSKLLTKAKRKDPACAPLEKRGSLSKHHKEGRERSHPPKQARSHNRAPPLRTSSTSSGKMEKGNSCGRLAVVQHRERSHSHKESQSPKRAPPLRTSSTSSGKTDKGDSCRLLPVVQRTSSVASRRTGMLHRKEEQVHYDGPKETDSSDLATSRRNRLMGSRRQLSKRSIRQGEQRSSLLQRSKSDRIMRKAKSLDSDNAASTNKESKHPTPARGLARSVSRQRRGVSSIQRAQLERSLHFHDSWMVADLEYDPVEPTPRSGKTKQSIRALSKDPASAPLRTRSPSRTDIGPRYTYSAHTA